MIPAHLQPEVVASYRRGESPAAIYRRLWPAGNPAVSVTMLGALLQGLAAAEAEREAVAQASDALPTEMDGVEDDLIEARQAIMRQIRGGAPRQGADGADPADYPLPGEEPGCNPLLFNVLAQVVKVHVAVSKHRIELQRHRAACRPDGRTPPVTASRGQVH